MDRFFDKLGDILQSLMGDGSGRTGSYDLRDPDMREAIEELDAYLESGGFGSGTSQRRTAGSGGSGAGASQGRRSPGAEHADPSLRRDYATLEVAFAAPFADVRKSYKRLLHKYHPDRFSGNAEKQALANEVTQRLNEAFDRIERAHKAGRG
jgi:DnaJ-domain-containing protein 1